MSGTTQPIGLPFQEAIDFFRRKLDLQTPAWDTIQKGQHAVAFTVAGAMQAELLADLRGAVDKALAGGGTLAEFRAEFDAIVKRHGWSHKGSPGWRSRVIFETNLRTAYAAGIWEQAHRTKLDRPYLRYVAVMDKRTRPQHEAWHGTILPIGHEFWATHFPPNGWGCRCTVITVSARELARRNWKVSDPAPSSARMPRQVQRSDGTVEIQELPPGIDPGWDYNVGQANAAWQAARLANDRVARMPPDLAAVVMATVMRPTVAMAARREATLAEFADWAKGILDAGKPDGSMRTLGAFSPELVETLTRLAAEPGSRVVAPSQAAIGIDSNRLLRVAGKDNRAPGRSIPLEDVLRLPAIVAQPEAVLLERQTGDLLFVFAPNGAEERGAKLILRTNYVSQVDRQPVRHNAVVSGGLVTRDKLQDAAAYEVLFGEVR